MSILIKLKIDLSMVADISRKGDIVHIKDYGMIKVFKNFIKDDDFEYWETNDLNMNDLMRLRYAENSWIIEKHIIAASNNSAELSVVRRV